MVTFGVWNFITSGTASPRTGSWHIEILRDTAVVRFRGGFVLSIFGVNSGDDVVFTWLFARKTAVLLGIYFASVMICSQQRYVAIYDLNF